MAITDYASLKTTIADYLHRSDLSDDVLSNFVQFAEARLNRKLRLLQQEAEAQITLTSGTDTTATPTGTIGVIDLLYKDDKYIVQPQSIRALNTQKNYDGTEGRPHLYAVSNGYNLIFNMAADQDYTLVIHYFKGWDVATDDTNWLLQDAPDAYLYAALLEAKAYVRNNQDVSLWSQALDAALRDLSQNDNKMRRNATARIDSAIVRSNRFDINRGW